MLATRSHGQSIAIRLRSSLPPHLNLLSYTPLRGKSPRLDQSRDLMTCHPALACFGPAIPSHRAERLHIKRGKFSLSVESPISQCLYTSPFAVNPLFDVVPTPNLITYLKRLPNFPSFASSK